MKKEEFVCFATETFNRADSRHQNICPLTASANNNLAHDLANKKESTDDDGSCEMKCIVNENNRGGTQEPLEEDKNSLTISITGKINFFH